MTDSRAHVLELCAKAKAASPLLAKASGAQLNRFLLDLAEILRESADTITAANAEDISFAKANDLSEHMLDRLMLNKARLDAIADSVVDVAKLPSPIGGGEVFTRPNGLIIRRTRVPLGTVGMIYEARPNVTVDAAVLCLKTGNTVVLRGGKEAINSNRALVDCIRSSLAKNSLPEDACCLITDTSRASSTALMTMRGYIDVLIPRGGKGLISSVVENATVPVIETGAGVCHLYVDKTADTDMAVKLAVNAKTSRPAVCNAIETLLVHREIAAKALPAISAALPEVELRCDGFCHDIIKKSGFAGKLIHAADTDWDEEYDDLILAVKAVDSTGEAIEHINTHSTRHSDCIVTSDIAAANAFRSEVDSACVYVNASTRFTDGGEFGLGAEIGITTQKLHARGPMGLDALTTVKYLIDGDGQIR